ncbi:group2 RNA polymerase sigma factor (plasmid) [Leptolyngbya sp. NIES-3755]|nr:group2 RNA polymerase sigma factor [Leptolyngbya sp. NIES-3755]
MDMAQNTLDLVQLYLQDIGRFPLLNHAQELHYGEQVQMLVQLQQIKTRLASQLKQEPTIAEWSVAANLSELELKAAIASGELAKRKLIEANLRFVVAIAKRYQKRNIDLLDLIQEGSLGLEKGVEKFDPSKGYRFSTYAYWWIRRSITHTLALQSRTVRLPGHITEKLNKVRKVQQQLTQQLGRTATIVEIAEEVKLSPDQIREYLSLVRRPLSLNQPIGETENDLQDLLPSEQTLPSEYLTDFMLRHDIKIALSDLPSRERDILSLRFGLIDGQSLSFNQIGHRLGLSRERVRQLERQALHQLKRRQFHLHAYLIG